MIITSFYRTFGYPIICTDTYAQCYFGLDTSNNDLYKQVHWLVRTPFLSIKASNVIYPMYLLQTLRWYYLFYLYFFLLISHQRFQVLKTGIRYIYRQQMKLWGNNVFTSFCLSFYPRRGVCLPSHSVMGQARPFSIGKSPGYGQPVGGMHSSGFHTY